MLLHATYNYKEYLSLLLRSMFAFTILFVICLFRHIYYHIILLQIYMCWRVFQLNFKLEGQAWACHESVDQDVDIVRPLGFFFIH